MLQYEKIDASEVIDVNKTSASKKCEPYHYWFFKDVGFKFEDDAYNGCHGLLTTDYLLENIAILNAKGSTFRCILRGIKCLKMLNNSVLQDKGFLNFSPNKTPMEIIKVGAFGGTYFRQIYSGINGKWYKNSWKEFDQLKNIDAEFYATDYYDKNLNKQKVKTRTSVRFWENKGWINEIDPCG